MTDGKYLPFKQDGVEYNLYDMPEGFVIKGDLDLSDKNLTELPDLSDVVVEGDFSCCNNRLTSLKGAPKEVGGSFACYHNRLTTLKGAPQKVGERFDCYGNNLTSLEGAPSEIGSEIGDDFSCFDNNLKSLFGIPPLKNGDIQCDVALGQKYAVQGRERGSTLIFSFDELSKSPMYQNEVKIDELRQKKIQEQAQKRQEATAATHEAFKAWLKNKGIDPSAK